MQGLGFGVQVSLGSYLHMGLHGVQGLGPITRIFWKGSRLADAQAELGGGKITVILEEAGRDAGNAHRSHLRYH